MYDIFCIRICRQWQTTVRTVTYEILEVGRKSIMNEFAEQYAKVRLTIKKISIGQFEIMLNELKKKYKVNENVNVRSAQKCIRQRYERKSLKCKHRGTESPMSRLEPAILEIALQRG